MFEFMQPDGEEEEEEISLKTLKKSEIEKIMKAFEAGRDVANKYYSSVVEPKILKRISVYEADEAHYKKKFPRLSEMSNWVSRDIKTTIDWLTPSMIEVFVGSDDPIDVQGVNVEDDGVAKKIQQLLKYQVERKNPYFVFLYSLIREGLKNNYGVAKIYWKRDEMRTPMEIMASADSVAALLQRQQAGEIEITDIKPLPEAGDLLKISYDEISVKANHPVLENLSPSELRFTPESKSIHDAKYVAHRKIVKGDYLKRKEQEGIYQDIQEALEQAGNTKYTSLDAKNNPSINHKINRLSDDDLASKDVELYEAYLKVDYNNDGIFENIIVHAVGDVPLRIAKNEFEMPPFFIWSPEHDPYNIFGKESYADTLEQLQDLKTALVRQLIIATAKNNAPQKFIQGDKVDMDAVIDNSEIVLVNTDVNGAVMIPPSIPISPTTMELIQYAQNDIESQSGSTRYNQGLDSNSLNKTATGINAIMGAADKRIRLIARLFAENVLIPIFKFLIVLNQKFLDEQQLIRLTNENVTINKNELNIDYDLTVNVGQGAGTKEMTIQYIMVLIQQLYPLLQQQGVIDEENWYNIAKELHEKMGLRNVGAYLTDPASPEAKQKKAMLMQQAQQQQAQAQQQQTQAAQQAIAARNAPRLSANYKDLPADAKVQLLDKFGVQTTPQSVERKELIDKT